MAARKKSTAGAMARKARARTRAALARIEGDLPPSLREYAKRVRGQLNELEKDIARAQLATRRRAARLLREASQELGRLEAKGEANWRKLTTPYRRQAVKMLQKLEKAVAPAKRKAPARKAVRKARRKAVVTAVAAGTPTS
jgi:hypothetical protein